CWRTFSSHRSLRLQLLMRGKSCVVISKAGPEIETALRRRAGIVLAIARDQGHRSLLLGAWGCGVFRNSPSQVADTFGR
ncbi:MAG: TIGR02452 family protein, partial [Cyanobacteria bacterium P01_G01_bin.38]